MQRFLPGYEIQLDSVDASGSEEEGYTLGLEFTGFESASELVEFYNTSLKQGVERPDTSFGSSESARKLLEEMDTSSAYSGGEWAVDTWETVEKFAGEDSQPYENAVDAIAAITLASVALSEGAEPGRGGYSFYQELSGYSREPGLGDGPITLDITEEQETPGEEEESLDLTAEELEPDEGEQVLEPEETGEEDHPSAVEKEIPYGMEFLPDHWKEEMEGMETDEIMDQVHDEIVSGTIPEAKETMESIDSPDYGEILEAEKRGKNRVTLKRYLEEKVEEE